MVDKKQIKTIIDNTLSNIEIKCSNNEIRSKLKKMSDGEKQYRLQGKLTPAEKDHYLNLFKKKKEIAIAILEHEKEREEYESLGDEDMVKMVDTFIKPSKNILKEFEDAIFNYEKRIFNNYKSKENKNVNYNINDYREDNQFEDDSNENPHFGRLENSMISQQANVDFTSDHTDSLTDYFGSEFQILNSMLWGSTSWERLPPTVRKHKIERLNKLSDNLSSAIESTQGTDEPIMVYHGGEFDVSKVVGDKLTFKGFTSASFQISAANDFAETFEGTKVNYIYRILLPKGSKGVCANDRNTKLTHYWYEHELLLDKGLSGDIVDIDVENHIVTLQA